MNRYWIGIAAGSLAVFGVGMAGISLGRKGLHELKTAVGAPVAEALQGPLDALRFRLDGRRIGRIESLDVRSDGGWTDEAVHLAVRLDDPALADQLGSCAIAGASFRGPRNDAEFRCVTDQDIADEGLVQIGAVAFEPGSLSRPLYLAEHERRSLERSEIRSLQGTLTSPDGRTVRGEAAFDVQDRTGARERGVVRIQAGDGRAFIDIRDQDGRRLFQLNADGNGVSLNARDPRGRELLKLLAGEAGVSLKVDRP